MTAPKAPRISEETKSIDQDGGTDVVDLVAVSADGSEIGNATKVVSETDRMPIKDDVHGRPFGISVKPIASTTVPGIVYSYDTAFGSKCARCSHMYLPVLRSLQHSL